MTRRLLLVDDDALFADSVAEYLEADGIQVDIARSVAAARSQLGARYELAIVDYELPDGIGLELAELLRDEVTDARLLLVTGRPALSNAVDALRAGIDDYLSKPVDLENLRLAVLRTFRSIEQDRVASIERYRRSKLSESPAPVSSSPQLAEWIERANRSDSPVLLQGATGTGKTRLAQLLHAGGLRASGPFLSVNCAAIAESLIEVELFGHERGAFTGAVGQRPGLFELAEGGTLFLDEIAELSLAAQSRLLAVIEDRRVRRVGGSTERKVNVRIVAATHVELRRAVAAGTFREDLRYRVEVLVMRIPTLQERVDEIPALTQYWLRKLGGPTRHELAPGELERLQRYPWPGNIRELRNVLERALLLQDGNLLQPSVYLDTHIAIPTGPSSEKLPSLSLAELETRRIREAVEDTSQTLAQVAETLAISVATLRRKLRLLGIPPR